MTILSWLKNWQFDWKSSLITALLLPIGVYLVALLRKAIKGWFAYLVEGLLYTIGRSVHSGIAARLSLKRYCRLRLADDSRYMFVPSTQDIKLEVDDAFVPLSLERSGYRDTVYDHSNLHELGNRIRVIGDPGS